GFFLDTMDSYLIQSTNKTDQQKQQAALVQLVHRLKQQLPNALIITNRGFEVIPDIARDIDAVAAESLYAQWNNNDQNYQPVATEDHDWLINQLQNIQSRYSLDIIAIDYLPPSQRQQARTIAKKILDQGFIPWVATPAFDYVGIGSIEVMPRHILMLYDSHVTPDDTETQVHRFATVPLEYAGYIADIRDVNQPLPGGQLKGRYAGIVSWFSVANQNPAYPDWLSTQIDHHVPVALLGHPGFDQHPELFHKLDIEKVSSADIDTLEISHQDKLIGFEKNLTPRISDIEKLRVKPETQTVSHLRLKDKNSQSVDLVVTGPWGGLALDPAVIEEDFAYENNWIINPFTFFKMALKLPDMPIPNVTTENGRRLWLTHIDGDGFPSFAEAPGHKLGAEILRDRIISRYPVPHTVSIVEGELHGQPRHKKLSPRMEAIARSIFKRPNVEIASHSYSHPYDWRVMTEGMPADKAHGLPIPGYRYDLEREIKGSAHYIDTHLAPPDKKTKVMLWSGEALATEQGLKYARHAGLLNMNGGNTTITRSNPALSRISPMSRQVGAQLQIYAPVMNENVFTNNWHGPYYGFQQVIESFQLTDKPRRIKPINIYYHFYSGTKQASLKALDEVYQWAQTQETNPVFASEYIQKVQNFQTVGIAKKLEGGWQISGAEALRSFRLPKSLGWPDFNRSHSIAGARKLSDGIYLHTLAAQKQDLYVTPYIPQNTYLFQANGRIHQWQREGQQIHFNISAQVPILLEISTFSSQCKIQWQGGELTPETKTSPLRFRFPNKETGDATLICHA
ncbi:MAG TPA: hypothetical protein ENJ84_00310, partial [Gammaproteobacteria bacterium]|nr:hypothetical protein [Gammaproteobacteria bacterium]